MEKMEAFVTYLQQEKKECQKREKQLIEDERKDEANLCKIEANIYDIFGTLYETAYREAEKRGEEGETARNTFLMKTKLIPENWRLNYEKAKEHKDVEKILIEETKLKTVAKIMAEYHRQEETVK